MESNRKDEAEDAFDLSSPLDEEIRAIWKPPPAPPAALRASILGAVSEEDRPIDLAAARAKRAANPRHRWISRAAIATAAAALVTIGFIGSRVANPPRPPAAAKVELTQDDETFFLASTEDEATDERPTLLDVAADE